MSRQTRHTASPHLAGMLAAPHGWLLLAVLFAAAFGIGMAGTGALALWADGSAPLPAITVGYTDFTVGDPPAGGGPLPPPATSQWDLPTQGFGTASDPLSPGQSFTAVTQIDAVSQGSRGLAWTLDEVSIDSPAQSGYLAAHLSARAVAITQPQDCTQEAAASGTALYDGPLGSATIAAQELIPAAGPGGTLASPVTTYLCWSMTLDPDLPTSYRNTATVTGQASGTAGSPVAVTATDEWNAVITPPDGSTSPTVTFTFDHFTYRGQLP